MTNGDPDDRFSIPQCANNGFSFLPTIAFFKIKLPEVPEYAEIYFFMLLLSSSF